MKNNKMIIALFAVSVFPLIFVQFGPNLAGESDIAGLAIFENFPLGYIGLALIIVGLFMPVKKLNLRNILCLIGACLLLVTVVYGPKVYYSMYGELMTDKLAIYYYPTYYIQLIASIIFAAYCLMLSVLSKKNS